MKREVVSHNNAFHPLRALGKPPAWWHQHHRYQGHRTNDCGPAALAAVLSAFHALQGKAAVSKDEVVAAMAEGFARRLPSSWRGIGGATMPWGMARTFNAWAAREGLPWRAHWVRRGSRERLLAQLRRGLPVTLLLVWEDGGAHYLNVVGFDPRHEMVAAMDPAHRPQGESLAVRQYAWEDIDRAWRRVFMRKAAAQWMLPLAALGLRRQMIVYVPRDRNAAQSAPQK